MISGLIGEPNIPTRDVVRDDLGKAETDPGFERAGSRRFMTGLVADTASELAARSSSSP